MTSLYLHKKKHFDSDAIQSQYYLLDYVCLYVLFFSSYSEEEFTAN